MKTPISSILRFHRVAAMALLALVAFPTTSQAKQKSKPKHQGSSHSHETIVYSDRERARRSYYAHPRSGFTFSFGTGYAGSGYYYGPPGAAYYYERPDVRFYRNRYDIPGYNSGRSYGDWGRTYGGSEDALVQQELYRLGYYHGPIDGDIGPGSSRAIARFEADHGLPVRGYVSRSLLNALRLR